MTPLEAEILRIIAVDGPMPVAQFMALCLSHPVHGYYQTRDPLGARGDFITAPEISQMFGELVGVWTVVMWRQMGSPDPMRLVELGPGRGTLMADALRAARVAPAFGAAVTVDLVETGRVLRQRQQTALSGLGVRLVWHPEFAAVPDAPLIAVANEFLDALPVHQAVRARDGWHERMVGRGPDGGLAMALHPEPLAGFESLLPPAVRAAPLGAVYEWRSDRPIAELAARVVRCGGAALVFDYGHAESGLGDTLQAIGGHRFAGVLERPGEVDLTAHVDFAAVGRVAREAGARVWGPTPQGTFLRRLGIETRAARLKAASPARAAEIDAALDRLAGAGPGRMGELFKVIAITDPRLPAPPGFGSIHDAA